jgi:hypothetical protein
LGGAGGEVDVDVDVNVDVGVMADVRSQTEMTDMPKEVVKL